jgi:hypothetical protein
MRKVSKPVDVVAGGQSAPADQRKASSRHD